MVEKRVCYICGAEIGENDDFCPICNTDAPPIKVNFDEFIDEEYNANTNRPGSRPSNSMKNAQKVQDEAYEDFFSDKNSKSNWKGETPSNQKQESYDYDPFGDFFSESTEKPTSQGLHNLSNKMDSYMNAVGSQEDLFLSESDLDPAPKKPAHTAGHQEALKESKSSVDPFDELFFDSTDRAAMPEEQTDYAATDPFASPSKHTQKSPYPQSDDRIQRKKTVQNTNVSETDSFDYGYDLDSNQSASGSGQLSSSVVYDDPFDELIGDSVDYTEKKTKSKKPKQSKKGNDTSNLLVPIVVVSVIVLAALITIIAIVVQDTKEKNQHNLNMTSDPYAQTEYNGWMTESTDSEQNRIITSDFGSQQINWLNLFISNFTEACITNIASYSSDDELIEFAINHAVLNDNDNVLYLGYDQILSDGIVYYDKAISAEYIRQRIERYFDVSVSHSSTEHFLFSEGRYYIPESTPQHSRYYSKVEKIMKNDDGTITVDYVSYVYHDNSIPNSVYYGLAGGSTDSVVGTGSAVLKNKYVGENTANYAIVNLYKTDNQNITLRNEENTTSAIQNTAVPEYWAQYADNLVPENRNYIIDLDEDDWNILFRATPERIERGQPGYNVIDKIPSGTVVYVDYIYNGTWAAFTYNGQHGFSSLYTLNDPTQGRIMSLYE